MHLPSLPFVNQVSFVDRLLFTKHLSVMLISGIPLPEAIVTIKNQTTNRYFQRILGVIVADVENGSRLQDALAKYPAIFSPLYVSLISVGEDSGNLEQNLQYLAGQQEKSYEFQKKVRGAMMYPLFIIVTALIIGSAVSLFVLPRLIDLFESLDTKLPLTTKILLFAANTMKHYGIFIIGGLFGILMFLVFLIHTRAVKPLWHNFLLTIPKLGSFIQGEQLAAICRNLGIMLKSGLPITTCLETQAHVTTNLVFKGYIENLSLAVGKGKTLEQELNSGYYQYMPPLLIKMLAIGEHTGKLDEMFLYLGNFFEEEVDNTAKNLPSIIEPVMMIIIAFFVAFFALAIISPIYNLVGSIRK